ncbi:MAG: LysE family transporter [Alphaproteobacteria bacterium]|nr:LysE family transporter [Alphaproteobacteria bacterium]
MFAFLNGLGLGFGLIVAIGAQNAFVLRQGLRREHVFAVAAVCAVCDAALIVVGIAGMGALVRQSETLLRLVTWAGAAFVAAYGALAARRALRPAALAPDADAARRSLPATLAAVTGFSLLNPHVYLDTVVLVGSVGGTYAGAAQAAFGAGAVAASVLWFFGLAYGARLLAPVFARPSAWRVLDLAIAAVMWTIAASLVLGRA